MTHRNISIIRRLKVVRSELTEIIRELDQQVHDDLEKKGEKEPAGKKAKLASELPEGWSPRPDDVKWAEQDYPEVDHVLETEKFRDYWLGVGGKKKNWDATWRNWIRQAKRYLDRDGPALRRPAHSTRTQANRERADRVAARLAERFEQSGAPPADPFEPDE